MIRHAGLVVVAALLCPQTASGDGLTMPNSARLVSERVMDAARYDMPVGAYQNGAIPVEAYEGRVEQSSWRIDSGALTTLQATAPLRAQLEAGGFEIVLDCTADACGGFDFRFGIDVIPAPDMYVDLRDFHAVSAKRDGHAINLIVSRGEAAIWIQQVNVSTHIDLSEAALEAAATPPQAPATDAPEITPNVAQTDPDFAQRLQGAGFAILSDLDFGRGSSDLGAGPFPSLQVVAGMMEANLDLRIALVGHTDTTGSLDINISISQGRAEAVRDRLASSYGIDSDRIDARGIGYLAPRAPILGETGQPENRRVEVLLLRP